MTTTASKGQQWFKLITGFLLAVMGFVQAFMLMNGQDEMQKQTKEVIHSQEEKENTKTIALEVMKDGLPKEILKEGFKQYFDKSDDKKNIDKTINYFSANGPDILIAKIDTLTAQVNKLKKKTKNSIEIIGGKKPEYITTTDGKKREIFFGSPNLKPRKKFYYYMDEKDEPVPIYFVSPNE